MVKGVSIVARMLDENFRRNMLVYYDPDPDGVFSGHAVHEFLMKHKKAHRAYINNNRGHGVFLDYEKFKDYFVWNVDSGVSFEKLKEIVDSGISIVSIDHHELEGKIDFEGNSLKKLTPSEKDLVNQGLLYYCNEELGTEGIILNNQYPFEKEEYRFMSGCGVVLNVLNQLDSKFERDEHNAWHGITLLTDSREIENPIAFDILKRTYETDIQSTKTIKHITDTVGFNKFETGYDTLDRSYIDFYLSPFINAMLRLNRGYEAINWFSGSTLLNRRVKEEQKSILGILKERTTIAELNNILLVNVDKYKTDHFEASNFIGLLANRMLTAGKTVVITCSSEGKFERGSVRGYSDSTSYRSIFEDAGLIALGHRGAFGLKNFIADYDFWRELDRIISIEDAKGSPTYKIHTMTDISKNRSKLREYSYENQFLRPFNKHYIKYLGLKFIPNTIKDNFQEYTANGIPVRCFDRSINIRNGHILPSMSKGYMSFYLERIKV